MTRESENFTSGTQPRGVTKKTAVAYCGCGSLAAFDDWVRRLTPKQRIWLPVVNWAFHKVNADFAGRAAKHVPEISGRQDQEVGSFIADLADWVRAEGPSRQFVFRPFQSMMSLKTVPAFGRAA